jgi:hypothetical protein
MTSRTLAALAAALALAGCSADGDETELNAKTLRSAKLREGRRLSAKTRRR